MASIFSLFGEIFIDNEKAEKSIDSIKKKGEDTGKSFSEKFGSIAKTGVKVGTTIVGATTAVVSGLSAMAINVSDTAGSIDDSAKKVGTSAEEYQKWAYAAKLGGMETSKLESLMIKQQKAFSDAKDGSKSMSEAYERLGINIKNIGSSGDAFNEVINALADMEDETTRNALANDIFGKSYAELAPLLAEGSEGIAKWKQEAEDLGGVMSNEAVAAGADFGDVIDKVKTACSGMFNQLSAKLLPILEQFLQLFLDNLPFIQELISSLGPVLTSLMASLLPPIIELVQKIMPILVDLINKLLPFVVSIVEGILPVIIQLIDMLLPPLLKIIEIILPLLLNLIEPLLPLLQPILELLQPLIDMLLMIIQPLIQLLDLILPPLINLFSTLIEKILPPLKERFELVAAIVKNTFSAAFAFVKNYIDTIINHFKLLIKFIKQVFTGDWKGAWQTIKDIFSNIFNGIKNAFKIPINWIIDGLNIFIKAINKIKIPDWVPGVGGKGFNIPLMKKLRVGLDYVPYDDMPALLHKGETVLTKEEAIKYRNNKQEQPSQNIINYNNKIVIEKLEVREEHDIERIAEELYYLQKKEVGA